MLRGLEKLASFPEAHPIKINAVAIRGFTEEEVLPFAELARQYPLRGPVHRVHAARRRPRLDADQVLTGAEIHAAINEVYPLEPEPREPSATARVYRFADGHGRSASSTPSPSRSAPTATGSA